MDTICFICGCALADNPPSAARRGSHCCELCHELGNDAYRILRRENKIADALLRNEVANGD